MKELLVYGLMTFYICSFFGYFLEVGWVFIGSKKLINRGFLSGPVIPIYGIGAILILFCLLRYYSDPEVVFVFGIIITSSLEYFTSFLMEKIFHNRWWDYKDKKYNLNGRICLKNSLAFGVMALVIIYLVTPLLYLLFDKFNFTVWLILVIIISIVFLADLIYSVIIAYNLRNRLIIVEELKQAKISKIPILFEKKLKQSVIKFRTFPERLLKAFPNIEKENHKSFELMDKYRKQLKEKRKEIKKFKKKL